ncbi:hypothetical protein C8R46DRAFT_544152 [Mycena filopes]|nr:hypothetical protein C8R46DRAFT_544152 [Mycena filopes]
MTSSRTPTPVRSSRPKSKLVRRHSLLDTAQLTLASASNVRRVAKTAAVAARKQKAQEWSRRCEEDTWHDDRLIYKSEAKGYYLLKKHELATIPHVEHRSPQGNRTQTYHHKDVQDLLRRKLAVLAGEMNADSDSHELLSKGEGLLSEFLQKRRKERKREVKTVSVAESERRTARVYHPKPEGGGGPQETGNDTSADGLGVDDVSESVPESEPITAKVYHEGPQETGNDTSLSADSLSLDDVSESVAESERITAEVYSKTEEYGSPQETMNNIIAGLVDMPIDEEAAFGWSQGSSQDGWVDMAFAKARAQISHRRDSEMEESWEV